MNKQLIKLLKNSLNTSVIILALLALTLNGVSAAQRIYDDYNESDQSAELSEFTPQLRQGPPAPEEMPGNMEDSQKANSEQMAILTVPFIIKTDNSENRYKHRIDKQTCLNIFTTKFEQNNSIASTANLVSSDIGHRFTLVGLKPSGTS